MHKLAENLRRACSTFGAVTVRSLPGRLSIRLPDGAPWDEVRERLAGVFGVANFARVHEAPRDLDALARAAVEAVRPLSFGSFRVTAKRSDKTFARNSVEIDRAVGAAIHMATGVRVDLERPELTVFVEVLRDRICFAFEKEPGPGGFPVGGSGRVLALLSGGIDSPVAAWRLMKRGCTVVFAHFHAFPLQDHTTIDKTRELAPDPHPLAVQEPAAADPVRPGAADDRGDGARPAAGRALPAVHGAHRRGAGHPQEGEGARHRRGVGQVASQTLGNICRHRRGRARAHPAAAGGNGQGRDHRAGAPHRDLRRQHAPGPGLLPALHPAQPGHVRRSSRRCGGRGERARHRRPGADRHRGNGRRALPVS